LAETVSRFRPGTQQRGEDTRRRILDTALELFATDGFEGASTRTLAERAGVNLPAIQYYFGSKEGLYRAVVEQIAQHMAANIAPLSDRIRSELADGHPSHRQLVGLMCDLLDILIFMMLDDSAPDRESQHKFFARMEVEPHPATDALLDSMVHHVMTPCAAVVGRLVDLPADDEEVLLRAMTIIGQVKIFCGWGTSRILRWDTISDARIRRVQTLIREHVHAIFRNVRRS
jgi:AcrR family transcriptional regulator